MSRKIHSKKAFTLIEVMVVVAIIGILASMGISSYTRALQNGRDARRKSDLDEVRKALQIYWAEHLGNAPASLDLASLTTNGSNIERRWLSGTRSWFEEGDECHGSSPSSQLSANEHLR